MHTRKSRVLARNGMVVALADLEVVLMAVDHVDLPGDWIMFEELITVLCLRVDPAVAVEMWLQWV